MPDSSISCRENGQRQGLVRQAGAPEVLPRPGGVEAVGCEAADNGGGQCHRLEDHHRLQRRAQQNVIDERYIDSVRGSYVLQLPCIQYR